MNDYPINRYYLLATQVLMPIDALGNAELERFTIHFQIATLSSTSSDEPERRPIFDEKVELA
jgi:hypothetical protein